MEIDFLGLNSSNCTLEQEKPNNPYIGGGVETSLSLSSGSSLNFSETKKWELADCEQMISSPCSGGTVCSLPSYNQEKTEQLPNTLLLVSPPAFRHPSSAGFLYDAAATANLRKMSQLSSETPALLYPTCPNVFSEAEKVEQNKVKGGGYTPTVAMARRATLARFLEKRLHRLNQAKTNHLIKRRS